MKSLSRQPQSPRQFPNSSSSLKVKVSLRVIELENLSAEKRDNHFNSNNITTQNNHQPVFAILSLSSDQNNNNMIRIPSLPIDPSSTSSFQYTGQKKRFNIQWPSDRGLASAETYRYLSPSSAQQSSTASTSTSSYYETEYETGYLCMKLNLVRGNEMLDLGYAYVGIAGKEEHEDIFLTLPIKDEEQLHSTNDSSSARRNYDNHIERTLQHPVSPRMVPSYATTSGGSSRSSLPPVRAKEYPGQNYFPKDPSVGLYAQQEITTIRIQISITKEDTSKVSVPLQRSTSSSIRKSSHSKYNNMSSSTSSGSSSMSSSIRSSTTSRSRTTRPAVFEAMSVNSKTTSLQKGIPFVERKVSFADTATITSSNSNNTNTNKNRRGFEYLPPPAEKLQRSRTSEGFTRRSALATSSSSPVPVVSEELRRAKSFHSVAPPFHPAGTRDHTNNDNNSIMSKWQPESEQRDDYEEEDLNNESIEYPLEELRRVRTMDGFGMNETSSTNNNKNNSFSSKIEFKRTRSFNSVVSLGKYTNQKFQKFMDKEIEKETYHEPEDDDDDEDCETGGGGVDDPSQLEYHDDVFSDLSTSFDYRQKNTTSTSNKKRKKRKHLSTFYYVFMAGLGIGIVTLLALNFSPSSSSSSSSSSGSNNKPSTTTPGLKGQQQEQLQNQKQSGWGTVYIISNTDEETEQENDLSDENTSTSATTSSVDSQQQQQQQQQQTASLSNHHTSTTPSPTPTDEKSSSSSSSSSSTQNAGDTFSFIPGLLTVQENGILLSHGLKSRVIAQTGQPVQYRDGVTKSEINFHANPDGGAVFVPEPHYDINKDVSYVYVSNSEVNENQGGVGAIQFDKDGNILDYRMVLIGTNDNCSGGRSPWNTWISCEEHGGIKGEIYEVDPFGRYESNMTVLGKGGGNFESVAVDNRDEKKPVFYITNDRGEGEIRRYRPDPALVKDSKKRGEEYKILTTPMDSKEYKDSQMDYLVLDPSYGTFHWTSNLGEGEQAAFNHFKNCEGIETHNGMLYFVSKVQYELFTLDLEEGTYKNESTAQGLFQGSPDQIVRLLEEEEENQNQDKDKDEESYLFFTEEGGNKQAGIFVRDSQGNYVPIVKTFTKESTGLAFSPDRRFMYFGEYEEGRIIEVSRIDGKPFNGKSMNLRHHELVGGEEL